MKVYKFTKCETPLKMAKLYSCDQADDNSGEYYRRRDVDRLLFELEDKFLDVMAALMRDEKGDLLWEIVDDE